MCVEGVVRGGERMYHECAGAPRGQKWASDSLRAGVAGRCELPNMGTGNHSCWSSERAASSPNYSAISPALRKMYF